VYAATIEEILKLAPRAFVSVIVKGRLMTWAKLKWLPSKKKISREICKVLQ
jgi:hypothetical protein